MRRAGGLALSLALHAVLLAVVAQALRVPVPFFAGLLRPTQPPPAAERLVFVQHGGQVGAAASTSEPLVPLGGSPALPAPRTTPTNVPPAPPQAAPARGGAAGTGGAGGFGRGAAGGPAEGLQPAYSDPRVWSRPEPRRLPPTVAERIDSMIAADLAPIRDSLAAEADRRRPTDWTFDRNGRTYGVDERFVHLGRLSIPTALLGLLPLKAQANPIAVERERKFSAMSREVREQAHRLHTEADFREAVRLTRERKDRERTERRAQAARAGGAGAPDR